MSFNKIETSVQKIPDPRIFIEPSFRRIAVAHTIFGDVYDKLPDSTRIMQDILISLISIEDVQLNIQQGDLSSAKDTLSNIIRVFNENIKYINKEFKIPHHFTPRTFEEYCKTSDHPKSASLSELRADHHSNESLREFKACQGLNEIAQLEELCFPSKKLATKILCTIGSFHAVEGTDKKTEFCALESIEKAWLEFFPPRLRKIEVPSKSPEATKSSVINQNEPKAATSPSAILPSSPAVKSILAPVETEEYSLPIVGVTVKLCEIKNSTLGNNTLGVCCEPDWQKAPVAFTKDENGNWAGQAPIQKNWKFVLMQGDTVVKWENRHGNRKCDGSVGSVTLDKVTF